MSDDIKFTCEECGKLFDPDPDTMLELHIEPVSVPADELGQLDDEAVLTRDELQALSANELREIGLTPEMRRQLLAGEEITAGGICICIECQDKMEGADE